MIPLHKILIPLQVGVCIPEDKKVTIGNLSTAVQKLQLDKMVVENIVGALDDGLVKAYAGEKYMRISPKRYQRAGPKERHPITSVGKLDLDLNRIKDNRTGRVFKPIEDVIEFHGKKHYQEDISMISVELATKMTYRDAVLEGKLFTKMPSASTINRRAIEYGKKIQRLNSKEVNGASVKTALMDGTKCHSQERGKPQNVINISLGLNEKGEKVLLDVRANKSWEKSANYLNDIQALDKKAAVIGDGDREMINALVTGKREFQMDLVHLFRTTGYKLWQDAKLSLDDRKSIVRELEEILYTLKNSVKKHIQDENIDALKRRINSTVDALKKKAKDLHKVGCSKVAKFIRKFSNACVTFARLAVEGIQIPWNSNIIERLMGEISKRCKHKWMRWTTKGLEAILNIILVRYTSVKSYHTFKSKIMRSANVEFIKCKVNIVSVGGDFNPF